MQFSIMNRFTGDVNFVAEIECEDSAPLSIKRGMAVKWAIRNKVSIVQADLRNADLRGIDLCGANLRGIDLRNADLRGIDLCGANLRGANLRGANLRDADLRGADLRFANLRDAYLRGADLRGADLRFANLHNADLHNADLRGADLRFVNLHNADLRGAGLSVLMTDIWTCYIQQDHIRIGCQYHAVADWLSFSDEEINAMDSQALAWWVKWKDAIMAVHASMTYKSAQGQVK